MKLLRFHSSKMMEVLEDRIAVTQQLGITDTFFNKYITKIQLQYKGSSHDPDRSSLPV